MRGCAFSPVTQETFEAMQSRSPATDLPGDGPRLPLARRFWLRWLLRASADSLEPSIYRFILRYSLRDQIYLVVVTLLSFPFLYYSLELPKLIINHAIGGAVFPVEILGYSFEQIPYLVLLCTIFLGFVLINGWFKYHLNIRKGRVGERMLRRLRY